MSAYIKLSTLEYPRHEGDIRLEHQEIREDQTGATFPCPDTYALVTQTDRPNFDSATQAVYELAPVQNNGTWTTVWAIRALTDEELEARAKWLAKIENRNKE